MFDKAIDFYHCKQKNHNYIQKSVHVIFKKKYGCRYTKNIE